MKRHKYPMLWIRFMVLCLPVIAAASCADTGTSGMRMYNPEDTMVQTSAMKNAGRDLNAQDLGPLVNTKWLVTNMNPKPDKAYVSMTVKFQPDGSMVQTTVSEDRSEKIDAFGYRIVGSTLLINKPKGEVNARFKMEGTLLVIDTGDVSMILQRMK